MCAYVLPMRDTRHVAGMNRHRIRIGVDVSIAVPVADETTHRTETDNEQKLAHDVFFFL